MEINQSRASMYCHASQMKTMQLPVACSMLIATLHTRLNSSEYLDVSDPNFKPNRNPHLCKRNAAFYKYRPRPLFIRPKLNNIMLSLLH